MRTSVGSDVRRRAIGAVIAAAALSLGVAACGSSAPSGTAEDPAALAPASSVVYVSAVVRPTGSLARFTLADASVLNRPHEPLSDLLRSLAASTPLAQADYATEVKPWLGSSAGVFASAPTALADATQAIEQVLVTKGFSSEALLHSSAAALLETKGAAAAVVLDTSDVGHARAFLTTLARREHSHATRYRGIAFDEYADGGAMGIVGKFVVVGNEAGLRAAIDTHLGAPSLKRGAQPYAKLAAKSPAGTLASVYINPVASPAKSSTAQAIPLLQAISTEGRQALISIVPENSQATIDADVLSTNEAEAVNAAKEASSLVQTLPKNTSIGIGVGHGGARASRSLHLLSEVASLAAKSLLAHYGGPSLSNLAERLARHPRALQSLFAEWDGPAAAFVQGSALFNIGAALELTSTKPTSARAAIAKLGAVLGAAGAKITTASIPGAESAIAIRIPGLPVLLDAGADSQRLAIGLGPESVRISLGPPEENAPGGFYEQSVAKLGGKPVVIAHVPTFVLMLNSLGINENPTAAPVVASLHSLLLAAGAVQGLGEGIVRLHIFAEFGPNYVKCPGCG